MRNQDESWPYSLLLGSLKPEAQRFKRWVTHEVLPAILRTGGYVLPELAPAPPSLPLRQARQRRCPVADWSGRRQGPRRETRHRHDRHAHLHSGKHQPDDRNPVPGLARGRDPIRSLNAWQLGRLMNMLARAMNQHLAACGLQHTQCSE